MPYASKAAQKQWRERNAERLQLYGSAYRQKHGDNIRVGQHVWYATSRLEALQHYSGLETPECGCCHDRILSHLTFDHVAGNGAAHRREIGMGHQSSHPRIAGNGLPHWLKTHNWPVGFQVLCWNCNCAKHNRTICPHRAMVEPVGRQRYGAELKTRVLQHYSQLDEPACVLCGTTGIPFLTIDHINGGGAEHRRSIGHSLCAWLKREGFPEGFRILCWNCNCAPKPK